jgi:hypothetical protein
MKLARRQFLQMAAGAGALPPLTASDSALGQPQDPLARIAQRWPGRARLNLVLGEIGYGLPNKYVDILVADLHCSREQINLYYNEVAKEYFLSLGKAHPFFREFRGEVPYRSRFIDDLYAARPPGERRAYPPCLASVFNMTAVPSINKQMDVVHKAEAEKFYGRSETSIESRDDLVRIFFETAKERGFSAGDGVSAVRQFSGYFMKCDMEESERAWRYETRTRLALVDSETGNFFRFFLPILDVGFAHYVLHSGNRLLARLGIRAQLDFLGALGSSLA